MSAHDKCSVGTHTAQCTGLMTEITSDKLAASFISYADEFTIRTKHADANATYHKTVAALREICLAIDEAKSHNPREWRTTWEQTTLHHQEDLVVLGTEATERRSVMVVGESDATMSMEEKKLNEAILLAELWTLTPDVETKSPDPNETKKTCDEPAGLFVKQCEECRCEPWKKSGTEMMKYFVCAWRICATCNQAGGREESAAAPAIETQPSIEVDDDDESSQMDAEMKEEVDKTELLGLIDMTRGRTPKTMTFNGWTRANLPTALGGLGLGSGEPDVPDLED